MPILRIGYARTPGTRRRDVPGSEAGNRIIRKMWDDQCAILYNAYLRTWRESAYRACAAQALLDTGKAGNYK